MIVATKMVALLWMVIALVMLLWAWQINRGIRRDLDEAEEHLDVIEQLERQAGEHLRNAAALKNEAEEYRDKCRAAYLAAASTSGKGDRIDEG